MICEQCKVDFEPSSTFVVTETDTGKRKLAVSGSCSNGHANYKEYDNVIG